ncbi:MAG: type IV pilus modification protein PilV [Alcaligenaceae bacterium]|nr:MAG: type IV pilus modification protein PilV [Alcaligenaceae bacterium]
MNKRFMHGPQRSQRGVALLEVLVSVLLFSLGILGLIGLQARAIGLSGEAEDRSRASMLANDIVSEVWLRREIAIPTSVVDEWRARVADATGAGLPEGVGSYVPASGGTYADITITWKTPTRKTTAQELATLKTRVTLP